jgi:hydrogenase nickel incorporation protein HypA/HybF
MHELSLTQNIVAIAREHAQGEPVVRLKLSVGKLSGVMVDAIRFCFEVCCEGTNLAGCRLEITEPPGRARCTGCGEESAQEALYGTCPSCGETHLEFIAGMELEVIEMEVRECV